MNTITLIGKISSDLVCLTIGSYRVVQFNIAVPGAGKRNKDTGKNDIGHFPIEAWGRQAEALEKYCTTGTNIAMSGTLKQDTWADKITGDERSKIKILLNDFSFAGAEAEKYVSAEDLETNEDEEDSIDPFTL